MGRKFIDCRLSWSGFLLVDMGDIPPGADMFLCGRCRRFGQGRPKAAPRGVVMARRMVFPLSYAFTIKGSGEIHLRSNLHP